MSRQAFSFRTLDPWATLCLISPRQNHWRERRGPRPPLSSFDASGAPSLPDSPLAEGPDSHGHPHVGHPLGQGSSPAGRPSCSIPNASPKPSPSPAHPSPAPPAPRASRDNPAHMRADARPRLCLPNLSQSWTGRRPGRPASLLPRASRDGPAHEGAGCPTRAVPAEPGPILSGAGGRRSWLVGAGSRLLGTSFCSPTVRRWYKVE